MSESRVETQQGIILYEPALIEQIAADAFEAEGWPHAEPVSGKLNSSGRGSTMYVGHTPRQFVLRHFMRGGLIGKLVRDRYVYTGEDATRSFREFRLLAQLASQGLRVPQPAAAQVVRHGAFYTADIITARIPDVEPLSAYVTDQVRSRAFWIRTGMAIAEFHQHGVLHADMNAYNLQIDQNGDLWMLDFDRGRIAPPGPWRQKTLARLHRSLLKIRGLDPKVRFEKADWDALVDGYLQASA